MANQPVCVKGGVPPCGLKFVVLQIEQAVKLAQQLVHGGTCPWAIVSVWGMTGQPVSWLETPPNNTLPIEDQNDYSICVLPNDVCILMVASGQGDSFQTV